MRRANNDMATIGSVVTIGAAVGARNGSRVIVGQDDRTWIVSRR